MSVPSLPGIPHSPNGRPPRNLKVCVVTSEFIGPIKNGGIGTATTALIRQLTLDGHKVTLLYTMVENGQPWTVDKSWLHWVKTLADEGVTLEYILHDGAHSAWLQKSWIVKEFVGSGDFDLVYFNEHHGSGYFALLAKRAGFSPFAQQVHCAITHGGMEWVFDINDHYMRGRHDIEWMGLERRSVELADVVVGPSQYLLAKYRDYGWKLPHRTYHQPLPLFGNVREDARGNVKIDEVVFFGRLEIRKGLWLFSETLDRVVLSHPELKITFLGRINEASGLSSGLQAISRTHKWPGRVKFLLDYDQAEALDYLRQPGRLAVMPSIADNSPCVVYECMDAGIPFVITSGSGAEELVHPTCWPDILVRPTVADLAEKLEHILAHGAQLGRPRFDPADNLAKWSAWHRYVADHAAEIRGVNPEDGRTALTPRAGVTPVLVVVMDRGTAPLRSLVDSLSTHINRFGDRAGYLILSARRGDLLRVIFGLFEARDKAASASVGIMDPSGLAEAFDIMAAAKTVIVVNAEASLQTAFFMLATNLLEADADSVVSCAVATRSHDEDDYTLADLPSGDVPGLSSLGVPIGSSVWCASGGTLRSHLSPADFFDERLDELTSSALLGQKLMNRCRAANSPVLLLPVIGAMEVVEQKASGSSLSIQESRRAVLDFGVGQSLHSGGPAWLATEAMGSHHDAQRPTGLEGAPALPADHPLHRAEGRLRSIRDGDTAALADLAASLGRPELALRIAAMLPSPDLQHLERVSIDEGRQRPVVDLGRTLTGSRVFEFGEGRTPRAVDGDAPDLAEQVDVYVDSRKLEVRGGRISSRSDLRRGGPGKLYFLDVPLAGHRNLHLELRSLAVSPALLRVRAICQRTGLEIALVSRRINSQQSEYCDLPLHRLFGRATVAFELSGAEKIAVEVASFYAS